MRRKRIARCHCGPAGARAACSASRMDAIDLCEDEVEQPSPHENDAVWVLDDEDENEVAQAALPAAQASVPSAAKNTAAAGPGSTEVYVLDCGCQERHDSLVTKLYKQAEGVQPAGRIEEAVDSLSCSSCGTLLSAQDVWKLLGPETTSKLYTAVAGSVKQAVLAQQEQADKQSPAAQAATVAAVCCELWNELSALQALLLGGDPPAATPATASASRQPQRGKAAQKQPKAAAEPKAKSKPKKYSYQNYSSGNSSAWAAGTGFGGSIGISKAAQEAMSAAAKKQAAVDTAMTKHLQAITAILQDPLPTAAAAAEVTAGPSSAGPSTSRKRGRSDSRLYSGLPWPLCGVVLAGPLAWLLRLLYQNDSLMDVVGRAELYSAGMELMRHVGSSTDLLPLLQLPADDPRNATPAAHTSTAAGPSTSSNTLILTLRMLAQQAKLYQRSAEQLMSEDDGEADDEDTTAAVCLALDLSNMVQTLEEGLNLLWTHTCGQAGSLTIKPISAAADTKQQAAEPAAAGASAYKSGGGSGSRGLRGRNASASASAPPAAPDPAPAAQAQRYMSAMQPYRFIEADLLGAGHYFARDAADSSRKAAGGEVMRKRLKRITEELGALSTSLPLSWDSSILLAVHADRLDVLRALLLPHPDTPYGGGSFLFDIFLPPDYPDKPPKVQFLTTGEGRWRANPNLYECGKVCLSLLGTWSGPSWEPGVSTLLQVLVSLQSMVLVSDPFFNEPGFERQAGTASGRAQAEQYNAGIRLGTATHAILAQLRKPDPIFGEAVRLHYSHQGERVSALLQQWARETKHNKSELQIIVKQVQQEIRKLPALPAEPQQQQQQQQQQEVEPEGVSRPQGSGRSGRGRGRQQQPAEVCDADTDVVDLT